MYEYYDVMGGGYYAEKTRGIQNITIAYNSIQENLKTNFSFFRALL